MSGFFSKNVKSVESLLPFIYLSRRDYTNGLKIQSVDNLLLFFYIIIIFVESLLLFFNKLIKIQEFLQSVSESNNYKFCIENCLYDLMSIKELIYELN